MSEEKLLEESIEFEQPDNTDYKTYLDAAERKIAEMSIEIHELKAKLKLTKMGKAIPFDVDCHLNSQRMDYEFRIRFCERDVKQTLLQDQGKEFHMIAHQMAQHAVAALHKVANERDGRQPTVRRSSASSDY